MEIGIRRAFTLLELLVVFVLFAILGFIVYTIFFTTSISSLPIGRQKTVGFVLSLKSDTGTITVEQEEILKIGMNAERVCRVRFYRDSREPEPTVEVWFAGTESPVNMNLQEFKSQMKGLHIDVVKTATSEYNKIMSEHFK